jgi:hypothetical protein
MIEKYNFTYCPMQVNWTDDLVSKMLEEVLELDDYHWHYNEFRNCNMLSVFNPGGKMGKVNLTVKEKFAFTDAGNQCPTMIKFLSEEVLPWMEPMGRITILRTPPGNFMPVHLDCTIKESGTLQHKWRFVLKGDIEKLLFLDQDQKEVYVPDYHRCYVLDGGHPHRIEVSSVEKITICIGSPWKGETLNQDYVSKLDLQNAMYIKKPTLIQSWMDPILVK